MSEEKERSRVGHEVSDFAARFFEWRRGRGWRSFGRRDTACGGCSAGRRSASACGKLGAMRCRERLGYYPPALTGMRGNHDGSYTYAHGLRDGKKWDAGGPVAKVDDTYDLVVVGGGISGLAAAYFFRKAAGSGATDFDSRQSRRFWRPREAK